LHTRRRSLALLAGGLCAAAKAAPSPVVTILGDSITAGLGLPASQALPAQLQAALARLGVPATVRGAGVSGDTTAGGLARVGFSVQADTALCVVALGGNDLLQGVPPAETKSNLVKIIDKLKARRIGVLLAGLVAPPTIGAGYARDFNAVFPAVAKAEHVPLYADLRAGVGQNASLNQRDGLHPNAAGAAIIAARLAPVVARALRTSR
jgi:acyl-CoA thioesterase I